MLGFGAISAWAISFFGTQGSATPTDPANPGDSTNPTNPTTPTIPPNAPQMAIYTIMRDGGVNLTGKLL